MIESLDSVLCIAAIASASYGLGCPVVWALDVARDDRLTASVWSLVVGLVLAGTLLAVLGFVGMLVVPLVFVLTLVGCVSTMGHLAAARRGRHNAASEVGETAAHEAPKAVSVDRPETPSFRWPSRRLVVGFLGLAGLACLGSFLSALAPPTAGDALCYHLELPRVFLAERAIGDLPYSENATYPLLVEMWYLWGLALEGGVTAQLVHWGLGVLLALATVVLASPIVGRRWASMAGCAVLLVPGVTNQMTAPLNDVALALLTTLWLAACWRAVVDGKSRRWFVLAGLAAGGALGTKYLALVFALALATVFFGIFCRKAHRRRAILEGVAIVSVVALGIAGPWYVRAAWYRGNPVYPFLGEVFGSQNSLAQAPRETLPKSKSPLGRNPVGMTTAPWHVTMHPERFGGRGHQLGPWFLALIPGLWFTRRLRGLGTLVGVAVAYCVLWYLLRQNVRFLLPVVSILAVAAVWVGIEMRRFPVLPRRIAGAVLAVVFAACAVVPLVRCRDQVAVALGIESREDYLVRAEPTWVAAHMLNRLAGPDAHLLSQDYRAFYFGCRVTRENVYRRQTRYDRRISSPAEFRRTLKGAGFTHLLLAENLGDEGIQYDPTLSRLADAQWLAEGEHSLIELVDYRFADSDGAVRRYRLVMLR